MSGIPSWARVGAKVVCVLQVKSDITLLHPHPKKGGVYTIRNVVCTSTDGTPALLLEEIVLTWWIVASVREPGFNINGFRPLVTRTAEQDIVEHFAHHLRTPATERV